MALVIENASGRAQVFLLKISHGMHVSRVPDTQLFAWRANSRAAAVLTAQVDCSHALRLGCLRRGCVTKHTAYSIIKQLT